MSDGGGRAARAALVHALVAGCVGLVLGLPFPARRIAAPCVALALALPAAAIGWTRARGAPGLTPAAIAGGLAAPLVVVQGTYLHGLEGGGLDGAYAGLMGLAADAKAPLWVAMVAGLGAGFGIVGAILAGARRPGRPPLLVYAEVGVQCFALGARTSLVSMGLAMALALLSRAIAPAGYLAIPVAGAGTASVMLVLGGAQAPVWFAVLALADRLDRRLGDPEEER